MTDTPPLPPLPELQALFHYNPITGIITYLQQRGPRQPGEPAGATYRGRLRLYLNGYHCAMAVAWALYHGSDPSPRYVIPCDGNPLNLALVNLKLSDQKFAHTRKRGRSARRFIGHEKHIRYSADLGLWKAWHKRQLLGLFATRADAGMAKLDAMRQEQEAGGDDA